MLHHIAYINQKMAKKARLVEDNYASSDYNDYPSRKRNSFPAMKDEEIVLFKHCIANCGCCNNFNRITESWTC